MKKQFSFTLIALLIFSTEIIHISAATNYGEALQKSLFSSFHPYISKSRFPLMFSFIVPYPAKEIIKKNTIKKYNEEEI